MPGVRKLQTNPQSALLLAVAYYRIAGSETLVRQLSGSTGNAMQQPGKAKLLARQARRQRWGLAEMSHLVRQVRRQRGTLR